jgi:hypothetical protein
VPSSFLYLLLPLPLVAPAFFMIKSLRGRKRALRAAVESSVGPMGQLAASLFEASPGGGQPDAFRHAGGGAAAVPTVDGRGVRTVGERGGVPVTLGVDYSASANWWGHGMAQDPDARWNGMMSGVMSVSVPAMPGSSRHVAFQSSSRAARELDPSSQRAAVSEHEFRKIWSVTGDVALEDDLRRELLALQLRRDHTDFTIRVDGDGCRCHWPGRPRTPADWAAWRETVSEVIDLALRLRASGAS